MQSVLRLILRGALRLLFKNVMNQPVPERLQRRWMRAVTASTFSARGTTRTAGHWGVPGQWVSSGAAAPQHAVLYLHGGGYTVGSPGTHASLTSHLARAANCDVLVPDYRLAPEHPYPAALDDAVMAYRALLERFPPERLVLAGDSAGGGLALCTTLALRRQGLPLPAALVLISPWVDLSLSGPSVVTLGARDPMLSKTWLQRAGDAYRGSIDDADPRVSPLFDALDGLPPMLIQVGGDEILLDDSRRLAARAQAIGVPVTLEIEDGYWHDFQVHAGVLRAADAALGRIAAFMRQHWHLC